VNEDLKELQNMVEKVKDDREVSSQFMKSYEREKYIFEQGVKEERERSEAAIKNEAKRADDEAKRADDATKEAEERTEQIKRTVYQLKDLNMSLEQITVITGESEEVVEKWLAMRK
jgi:methyl-accepting chemotaxis protein